MRFARLRFLSWVVGTCALGAVLLLSFQYFLVADFPIGQDVINHIANALALERMGWLSAFKNSIYPLAPIILVIWQKILGIFGFSYERTFIFAECLALFITSCLLGIFAWRVFKDWRIGLLSALFFASSRWANEDLRIGLFASVLSWMFFVATLFAVWRNNWKTALVGGVLLFLTHPLSFGVLVLITLFYVSLRLARQRKWTRLLGMWGLVIVVAACFYLGPWFDKFSSYIHSFFSVSSGRTFFQYLFDSEKRRMLFYGFSFLGLALLFFKKNTEGRDLILVWWTVAFVLVFAHILGFRYLDFRLYAYYEMAAALTAGLAVVWVAKALWPRFAFFTACLLALIFIYPNWKANVALLRWQLFDYSAGHITPLPEREALGGIASLLKPESRILTIDLWGMWFRKYGFVVENLDEREEIRRVLTSGKGNLLEVLQRYRIDYIFCSSLVPGQKWEDSGFLRKVYSKQNIRVYEVKSSSDKS